MREENKNDLTRFGGDIIRRLIDIDELQKIQNNFSAVTDVSLRIVDIRGRPITWPSKSPRLCRETLKDSPQRNEACGLCLPTFLNGRKVVDKNLSYACCAGLHNFIAPLRLRAHVAGYVIVGPVVLVMRKPRDEYDQIAEQLYLDADDFWNAILEIKVISFHAAQSLVELVRGLVEYTLRLAERNVEKEKEPLPAAVNLTRLNHLLNMLLDVAFEMSRADIGSVMFLDEVKKELKIHSAKGLDERIVRNTRVVLGEGISGTAAMRGEAFLIDENTPDNRLKGYLKRPAITSSMVIPLKIANRVAGVINLGTLNTSALRFSKENLKTVKKLVDLVALSINT